MNIEFTREELREIQYLFDAAEGRFPEAFYTAAAKISAALHPPRIADLLLPDTPPALIEKSAATTPATMGGGTPVPPCPPLSSTEPLE